MYNVIKTKDNLVIEIKKVVSGYSLQQDESFVDSVSSNVLGKIYSSETGEFTDPPNKAQEEAREWRDSELERTDKLMTTIDYPYRGSLSVYRQALRDWTVTEDFPETKPVHTESKTTLTRLEFISRLTVAEESTIRGSTDTTVKVVLGRLEVAEFVDLNDPQTSAMLDILVAKNLITTERKTEILSND